METNGDQWEFMRFRGTTGDSCDQWRLSRHRDTTGDSRDQWGLMRLRETIGSLMRLMETNEDS